MHVSQLPVLLISKKLGCCINILKFFLSPFSILYKLASAWPFISSEALLQFAAMQNYDSQLRI